MLEEKEEMLIKEGKNDDSLYSYLYDVVHGELRFDVAYHLKQYMLKPELLKTTKVSGKAIGYIYNNLKEWYGLVTNPNGCRILLFVLDGNDRYNSSNLCSRLKLNDRTVRKWTSRLESMFILKKSEFTNRQENRWRVCLDDPLIAEVVNVTAYFAKIMLNYNADEEVRKVKKRYSLPKNIDFDIKIDRDKLSEKKAEF